MSSKVFRYAVTFAATSYVIVKCMQLKPIPATRIDKFLWATRHFKTRSLASEDIGKGRVKINGKVVKTSADVRVGDEVALLRQGAICTFKVLIVSDQLGSAPLAQTLYAETPESIATRERLQEERRLHPEPALTIAQGRPTKRQRRDLDQAKGSADSWNGRWSASVD